MKAENLLKLNEFNLLNIPKFQVVNLEDDMNSIIDGLDEHKLYAVRSSCEIEDGDTESHAGQFDTFLNVKKQDVKENTMKVFESFGANKGRVIIQEMVNADYSGVVFTANPMGIMNEMVVVMGEGLGCNVVEDKIDTTTYYYNVDDETYYFEGKDYVRESTFMRLVNKASAVQCWFEKPMDVEFAIKDDIVYILQVRPITTFKENTCDIILDNSNIIESYPGISLPLTQEFVKEVYYKVFKSLLLRLTGNKRFVSDMDTSLKDMAEVCNNRVYYNITNWYKVLNLLPISKQIIHIWQDMLGVTNRDVGKLSKVPFSIKIKVILNFINLIFTSPIKMKALNKHFDSLYKEYKTKIDKISDYKELLYAYDEIMTELTGVWDITLVNDMYTFLFTAMSGDDGKERISDIKNIESMKPVKSLNNLVRIYDAQQESKFFKEEFDKHIELYGDRCLEELKLETRTYRTNPEILLEYIKNAEIKTFDTYKDDKVRENFFVKRAKVGIYNREVSRMNRSRIFGLAREIMLKSGKNLESMGYLEDARDVFYLYISELKISDPIEYKEIVAERKQEIEDSRAVPSYSRLVFNDRIINKKLGNVNYDVASNGKLSGIASSIGKVTGEVIVVNSVSLDIDVTDKIIVAESTDPGWVFLIKNSLGIIAERGSMLSHTAIITRELKKPSVVNVRRATQVLKTGDIVELDGYTGKITKIGDTNCADIK